MRNSTIFTIGAARDRESVLKVIVFGATGRVGRAVALTLLTRGHQVTAFARDASKLPDREEFAVIVGDAADAADIAPAGDADE